MKKLLNTLILFFALTSISTNTQAQAWEKNSKVLSLGFGASQFYHIDNYYYNNSTHFRNWYSPWTGQINFQGEFGIHKYVGIGFTTGIGGRGGMLYGYTGEVNAPIGLLVNFHFYQLIADKTDKNIHADKLDIYAGLNFGGGIAAAFYRNYPNNPDVVRVVPIAFGGLHAGVRYYFKPRVGINAEIGFGKSLINAGFVFKI